VEGLESYGYSGLEYRGAASHGPWRGLTGDFPPDTSKINTNQTHF